MPADWKPQQAALPPLAVTTPSSASSNGNTKTDDQETAPKAAFAAYNDKAAALEKVALPRKFLERCQGVFQSQVSCQDDRCAVSGLTRCIEYQRLCEMDSRSRAKICSFRNGNRERSVTFRRRRYTLLIFCHTCIRGSAIPKSPGSKQDKTLTTYSMT